jgi:hypothetical protein
VAAAFLAGLTPNRNPKVAQAFQPVQTQAEACGYKKMFLERNSV